MFGRTKVLKFNKKKHEYSIKDKKLESVTRFVHSFFSEFDAKEVARKLSKIPKNKVEKKGVRYFLKEWKQNADDGTTVHNTLEKFVKQGLKPDEISNNKVIQAIAYLESIFKEGDIYLPECQLYDEDYELAGTLDLLVIHPDGTADIIDYKTNKAIKDKAYKKSQVGLGPCSDLPDCNFVHYSLQLSAYGKMIEKNRNLRINELTLLHLREDSVLPISIDYSKYGEYVTKMIQYKKEEKNGKTE